MSALDNLTMPKLGLTMEEGTIATWYIRIGDSFSKGQTIFSVETDKIVTDIEASVDGRLEEILVMEGESAAIGMPIARLAPSTGESDISQSASTDDLIELAQHESKIRAANARTVATPRARILAADSGVDISLVSGSGPGGRVKAADIERAIGDQQAKGGNSASAYESSPGQWRAATRMEKSTADRLTAVKREIPHFYLSTDVNCAALNAFRERMSPTPNGKRLSVTQLIVAAVARSMAAHSWANSVWHNDGYRSYSTVDVGVAVQTSNGLMVPIVKNIGGASISAIAERISQLVTKARAQELTADDVTGGAISVSNAGMHDVTQMISIISPGQSSIVGVGSMRRTFRPDVAGLPAMQEEMNLTMSFDHRVFDGIRGLELLNAIKARLESPADAFA